MPPERAKALSGGPFLRDLETSQKVNRSSSAVWISSKTAVRPLSTTAIGASMSRSKTLTGLALVAGVAVVASGVAVAQDAIAKRKELMKGVGGATKQSVQMVKGETPFDAGKAKSAMDTIHTNWAEFAKLFPKGSETGGKTTAAPKIWQSFEDFEAKGKQMAADAAAASAAAAQGLEPFKAAFTAVAKNCKGCHQEYRIKK
jgi:cytochrome c556